MVLTFKVIKNVGSFQFYTYMYAMPCPILLFLNVAVNTYSTQCTVHTFMIHHTSDLPSYFMDDEDAT